MKIIEDLLSINKYSRPGTKLDRVMGLVIHWTAVAGQRAKAVRQYYESEEAALEHFGSAHFGIDLDGAIFRWIPEDEMARAVGSAELDPSSGKIYTDMARVLFPGYCDPPGQVSPNRVTLNVELCVLDQAGQISPSTRAAAVELAADVCNRYELGAGRLLRHYDIVGWKDCPRWFVNHPLDWLNFKREVFAGITRSPSAVENERTGRE